MKRWPTVVFWITEAVLAMWAWAVVIAIPDWKTGVGWGATITWLFLSRAEKRGLMFRLQQLRKNTDEKPEMTMEESRASVARGTMDMAEVIAPMAESAAGQRASLIASGWSEQAAEHMAASFYQAMLSTFIQASKDRSDT